MSHPPEPSVSRTELLTRRALILVLDGVGCGPAPDTDAYGDTGSDTIGWVFGRYLGLVGAELEGALDDAILPVEQVNGGRRAACGGRVKSR